MTANYIQIKCAANSTLQDFKLCDSAGAYTYHDSNAWTTNTCNRFIYWKTSNDILELTELSMDVNLTGNQLKLHFQKSPVLEGVSIHETIDKVYVLVATVSSVHRFIFNHPRKLGSIAPTTGSSPQSLITSMTGIELSRVSIFYNAYTMNLDDPSNCSVLSTYGSSMGLPIPTTSCSWLTPQKEAVFVIANNMGSLLVVRLGAPEDAGKVISYELKQTTIIGRLWSGIVPSIMKSTQEGEEAAISLVWHSIHNDNLIFALCRDLKIKMWSYKRQECLLSHPLVPQSQTLHKLYSNMSVRRPIILKKWISRDNSTLYLAAFIAIGEQRQFALFEPILEDNQYCLRSLAVINAPEVDLIDFCIINNQIWSLWINANNVSKLLYCPIDNYSSWDWRSLALHSQFTHKININSILVDPRELYIQDIFMSGNFSMQTIAKSISIMSRISESSLIGCKTELLIEEATKVVENKIRNVVGAAELSAEEYTALELESWRNLHSFCIQYDNNENKPLGLFFDPKTGFKGIIKKSNIEFPVKSDPLDEIIVNSIVDDYKYDLSVVCEDPSLESSLGHLLKSIALINETLVEDNLVCFEAYLLRGESPIIAAEVLIDNSLILATDPKSANGEPLKHAFNNIITKAPQLLDAINLIIRALESYIKDTNEEQTILSNGLQIISPVFVNCFSSNRGLNLLSESVKRMVRLRFNFCRDLLLFQSFIIKLRNKESLEVIEKINTTTIPITAELLNAYYLMTWICETPMNLTNVGSIVNEDSVALLSLLELNEYININRSGLSSTSFLFDCGPKTIVNYFIQNNGGIIAKKLLTNKLENENETVANLELWSTILPQYIQSIALLISPITSHFHLPEFLLGFGQYNLLIEYINKLDVWCEWNSYSRLFLKALSYLITGESYKSVSLFNRALFGVIASEKDEELFIKRIIGHNFQLEIDEEVENNLENSKLNVIYKYYNKLLQLFAIYGNPSDVIQVVDSALSALTNPNTGDNYNEHISSLLSTKFMAHLELGNTTEAYETMISNPDLSQKKICLRQFIVHHCDSGQLSSLTAFTYIDIEEEFVNIIESRARSTDLHLSNHINYYHLLYSYFVRDSNYRRAASIMYEYCRRLSQETNGIESIEKQVNSYVIVLNCLKIINPKYSWIVKHSYKMNNSSPMTKRKHGSPEQSLDEMDNNRKLEVEILDSVNIKCEYELIKSRLRLLQKDEKTYAIANTSLTASQTVRLLIEGSLYDIAFNLCQLLKLNYEPIFEGIVSKYIYLVQSGNTIEVVDVYDCFVDNDTPSLGFIACALMTPVDKMWHLITTYLNRYETPGQTTYKKCVAQKLLANGLMIPTCLKLNYQKQNCPEFLRLLITHNFIEEAFNLSIEYIRAFMGKGTDYFDIRSAVLPNTRPLYIPYHIFNVLLRILNEEKSVDKYKKMYNTLTIEMKKLRDLTIHASNSLSI
ncbi:nuclear pore complex protein Nup160-like [Oppia nitens]|uniref:nuclear pore complex protein Nup160-like n=1 Tax=Oppia nitens TaxID=1686743 RepID=UPI0023DB7D4E|nr:nuclear pore complex protein Nup160-like [Oppia nitens]